MSEHENGPTEPDEADRHQKTVNPADNTELLATARAMTEAGLHLVPVGEKKTVTLTKGWQKNLDTTESTAEALRQIASARVTGVGFERGVRSLHTNADGTNQIVAVLEIEGRGADDTDWMSRWTSTVETLSVESLIERLQGGWVETSPSGGIHWAFRIAVPDAEYVRYLTDHVVPNRQARRLNADGTPECVAEILLTNGYVVAAPSWGSTHPTGKPWVKTVGHPSDMPTLSIAELQQLSSLMASLDDLPQRSTTNPSAGYDDRTIAVASRYDRNASRQATLDLLLAAGWTITESARNETEQVTLHRDGHSEVRVGGASRQPAGLFTFSTSALPFDAEVGYYSPFAVRLLLSSEAEDPAALAEHLIAKGEVRLRATTLNPRRRPMVFPANTPTDRLVYQMVSATADAKHPSADMPFVLLQRTATGEPVGLLSLDRTGGLHRWADNTLTLALAVVQPAKIKKAKNAEANDEYTYEHSFAPGILNAYALAANTSEAISPVQYLAPTPLLLPDGSVVSEPGYHPAKRALVATPRRERREWAAGYHVPTNPSRDDAQRAANLLLDEVLVDFPFSTTGDKARALAYLLTLASRGLYGPCPGFLFDASDRGSGKTLLASIGRRIAAGSPAATSISYSIRDDEEIGKRLAMAMMSGCTYLHVDELPREDKVSSKKLSEMLTSDNAMTERMLGVNEAVRIYGLTLTVCGNNADLASDMMRRFLSVRQGVTGDVLAHERKGFRHEDLPAWVMEHRPLLLAALHTILACGLQAEKVADIGHLYGGYKAWASVVLQAMSVITVDGVDGVEATNADRTTWTDSQDEEGQEWAPIMQEWVRVIGTDKWASAAAAIKELTGRGHDVELPAALLPQVGQTPTRAAITWGAALKKRRGTAVRHDGVTYRVEVAADAKRGNKYRITAISTESHLTLVPEPAPPEESVADPFAENTATEVSAKPVTAPTTTPVKTVKPVKAATATKPKKVAAPKAPKVAPAPRPARPSFDDMLQIGTL